MNTRIRTTFYLGLLCFFLVAIIYVVRSGLSHRILNNEKEQFLIKVRPLMPCTDFILGSWHVVDLPKPKALISIEKMQVNTKGSASSASTCGSLWKVKSIGYGGEMTLLISTIANQSNTRDVRKKIYGIDILSHSETPGITDGLSKSRNSWLDQFSDKYWNDFSWKYKSKGGDFDQMTGATISSNAVMRAIKGVCLASKIISKNSTSQSTVLENSKEKSCSHS